MGTKPLITPGEILLEEFMIPLNLGKEDLSAQLNMSLMEISDILECKKAIDVGLAKKLSKRFGNSPKFWLNLQSDYESDKKEISENQSTDLKSCYA
ncbi:MAG: HigA family addiction module antitoxin [Desulfomonilaceae bacterium]|jgi:addiction module HigA family antidote